MPSLITRIRSGCGPFGTGLQTRSVLGRRDWCGAGGHYTTRRSNAHRTEIAEGREVLYHWHPWAGSVVRIHEAVEKISGTVLRCSPGGASERWLELPAWMFDRATCMAMRVVPDPVVEFAALVALQELLVAAARQGDAALSSNTPVLSPPGRARNHTGGNDDATAKPMSSEGSQTSAAA